MPKGADCPERRGSDRVATYQPLIGKHAMNKQELVDAVAAQTGDSKVDTGATVDAVIAAIRGELTKGKTVQLIGFGRCCATGHA